MTARSSVIAGLAALVLGGCADPYADDRPQPRQTTAAVKSQLTPVPRTSATAIVRVFATRWINWDWRSAAGQQRDLAQTARGALAVQLRANAASARIDASLARDRPGSRGAVAGVDLKSRRFQAGGVVVTSEQSYTDGHADLGGAHYRVYRVRLAAAGHAWEVTAWAPQP